MKRFAMISFLAIALATRTSAQTVSAPTPIAASASTIVPALVPYTGSALASDGRPLVGDASATFLLFKDEHGGEPLWIESQTIAVDPTGHYQVKLGATASNGLPLETFASGEVRWLEVQIAGQTTAPRVLLTSVPYALKAADASTLGGLPASAFMLAPASTGGTAAQTNAITPDASSTVTTTGGTNFYLPRFNAATTIVTSQIYDNGTSVGIGDVPNASARLDVNGAMIMRGNMQVTRTGNATTSKGYPSYGFQFYSNSYNSSSKANDNPYFQLQSEPTGNDTASPSATFNLLFSNSGSAAAETGFYVNPNGTIHFASAQTFPGTGAGTITGVTAGTDLTGGGTSGTVTLNLDTTKILTGVTAGSGLTGGGTTGTVTLAVDTTKIPTLSGTNTFTGPNIFGPSIYENTDVNIDNTNSNPGNISPGLRFGSASGEGMSSQRTSGGSNQYGLDLYTDYAARLSIDATGLVGIGTTTPGYQLEVVANPSNVVDAIGAFGTYSSGQATSGIYAVGGGGNASVGGNGGTFYGGNADRGADAGYGIFAVGGQSTTVNNDNAYSGVFQNDIEVSGNTVSDISSSKIDHPSDPANKYLVHASIQSSELMNLYTGNVTTDGAGHATVALPAWFEAENADFRYQLTVVGQQAQAWVAMKVGGGQFEIATSPSNVEVSWQITAVRQDAYAKAHPIVVEVAKPGREVGFYRHPELYGQPAKKQTEWGRNPKMMQRMEAQRAAAKTRTPRVVAPATSTPARVHAGTSQAALQSTLNPLPTK